MPGILRENVSERMLLPRMYACVLVRSEARQSRYSREPTAEAQTPTFANLVYLYREYRILPSSLSLFSPSLLPLFAERSSLSSLVYVVIKDVVQRYEDRHVREDRCYMVEISTTTDEFVAKRKIAIIGIYIYIYILVRHADARVRFGRRGRYLSQLIGESIEFPFCDTRENDVTFAHLSSSSTTLLPVTT